MKRSLQLSSDAMDTDKVLLQCILVQDVLRKKRMLVAVITCLCVASTLYLSTTISSSGTSIGFQAATSFAEWVSASGAKRPKILLWSAFFGAADFGVGFGDAVYRRFNCSFVCEHTANKEEWNSSDAIVFHMRDVYWPLPAGRLSHQKWIFYLLESPVHSAGDDPWIDGVFNWTMTYHRSSDVHVPYGGAKRYPPTTHARPALVPGERHNAAAWIVSNCQTSSKREEIYDKLARLVNITKYGACGGLKCVKGGQECYDDIAKEHMFYLSWENSLCEDYVTEKLWNALAAGVVPVVYGGADYEQILPLRSFIDVLQFNSTQHLASYLHYLSRNRTAYAEYYQWTKDYTILLDTMERGWCTLCEKLYQERRNRTETRAKPSDLWSVAKRCSHKNADMKRLLES